MAHLPQEILEEQLAQAATEVEVGGIYAHYKDPTKTYKVVSLVVLEATDKIAVVYEATYGAHIQFVRTLTSWLEAPKEADQPKRFILVPNP